MTIEEEIKATIREVEGWPKPGINFKDITPLFLKPNLVDKMVSATVEKIDEMEIDAIAAIESRGFFLGPLIATKLGVPFIPIRKKGKLPAATFAYKYQLEYGSAEVEIHKNHLKKGDKVLIHDDLLATGGTAIAASELVKMCDANIAGFSFVVNLKFLNGVDTLKKYSNNIIELVNY